MEGYDDTLLSYFICTIFGLPFTIWLFAFLFKVFIYNPYTYFCEPEQSYASPEKPKVTKPTRPVQSSYDAKYELDLPFED